MPEGETEETCKDHAKLMKKEMARTTNKNLAILKELMGITFSFRRQLILSEPVAVSKCLEDFPALELPTELKSEFARIRGVNNPYKTLVDSFKADWVYKILRFAQSQPKAKHTLALQKEATEDDPDRKTEIEIAAAVVLLPLLLKEKGGTKDYFLKICQDDESIDMAIKETKAPRLVGSGDFWDLDPLYIAAEGIPVVKFATKSCIASAMGLLIATYYVFNIMYPIKGSNVYLFLESALLGNANEAKKRVALNKFLAALSK